MADVELVESNGTVVNNTAEFSSGGHESVDFMLSIDALFGVDDIGGDGCILAALLFTLLPLLLLLLICEKNIRRKTAAFDIFFVCAFASVALLSLELNG